MHSSAHMSSDESLVDGRVAQMAVLRHHNHLRANLEPISNTSSHVDSSTESDWMATSLQRKVLQEME